MSQSLEKSVDHQLVVRFLNDDAEAFETLVRRHQSRLFHIAVKMLRDRDQAADMVQEAFVRAYRKLPEYRPTGSLGGWLAKITVNLCLNYLERRKRLSFPELSLARFLPAGPDSDPARAAEARDLRGRLREQVEALSPRRQAVLTLAMLGYSYEEMSEIMGESLAQVKSELFRARKKLREHLKSQKGETP